MVRWCRFLIEFWVSVEKTFQIIYDKYLFSLINSYSTAHSSEAAYIIGGSISYVAEYRQYQWRRLGGLNKGRYNHGSITIGAKTMIVGGYDTFLG